MDLSRPGPRSNMSGPPPSNPVHNNLVGRSSVGATSSDSISSNPNPSWHSTRDPAPNSANSDPQSQSQSQPYGGPGSAYASSSYDGFMHPMSSQPQDMLNQGDGPPGSGADPNRLNKKRQRDDHEELDPHPDPTGTSRLYFSPFFASNLTSKGKFNPSPARLAELTAGFPTPPVSNGPPALITTGRMTKTHADPLIAQRTYASVGLTFHFLTRSQSHQPRWHS
jgi:hypothetical protein